MTAHSQPEPKGGGEKVKGLAYTTPSGERRIRLVDLKEMQAKQQEDVYEVKLSDIIMGGAVFEGEDNREVRMAPINLKGMAALERWAGGDMNALMGNTIDLTQTIEIATILINQDRPIKQHVTPDEVGRLLTPIVLPIVNELIQELMHPLFAPDEADSPKTNQGVATGA